MLTGKAIRLGVIKLKAAKPGTLAFDFSDTGNKSGTGEGTKRYITINGANTALYTNRQEGTDDNKNDKKTDQTVNIPAGEIVIGATSYISLYKLTYTPSADAAPTTVATGTIPASGWVTLASAYDLDFSTVSDVEAYVVSAVSKESATLTKVTAVPGGTGVLVKAAAGQSYNIPVAASTPAAPEANKLVATLNAATLTADQAYVLKDGKLVKAAAGTLAAGKAYLPATEVPASARDLSFVIDGETTGISAVEAAQSAESTIYNVAGQRVAQPTRGLYIVNGKKVIVK